MVTTGGAKKQSLCLVLGGNGFIGSHITDKLAASGKFKIRILDRFDKPPQFNKSKNVVVVKGSAFDEDDFNKAAKGVDFVVHSLSATNPFMSDSNPYADIDNLIKNVEIFERCAKLGVKKIVFISSGGAVYGKLSEKKIAVEDDMPMPVSPYGIGKLSTEHYLEYFKHKYGMDYVIYRLSNPYGTRQVFQKQQGVIPAFIQKIIEDEEISIFGDGKNSRDYIYVEDAAQMIANTIHKKNKHRVYNIGSGQQTTLNDIVSALKEIFKTDIKIKYTEAPQTFLQKTGISTERFTKEFGEYPRTSFIDGLQKTVMDYRNLR